MQVKICGITSTADAFAAARLGADFIGLVRAPSDRQVTRATAADIVQCLPATTAPVIVVRDLPLDELAAEVAEIGARCVQLHGAEPPEYVSGLCALLPQIRVIKAWEVAAPDTAAPLLEYVRAVYAAGAELGAVLLDVPKGVAHPGFECLATVSVKWHEAFRRAGRTQPAPPLWCAGGLTPATLELALGVGEYEGVDVARGVETSPGVKDRAALRAFIEIARRL